MGSQWIKIFSYDSCAEEQKINIERVDTFEKQKKVATKMIEVSEKDGDNLSRALCFSEYSKSRPWLLDKQ